MNPAFVIGNGPSLQASDLELLRGRVSFAMNRIHLIYKETSWRPSYWVYTDIQDMPDEKWLKDCLYHLDQEYHCFIWSNLCTMIELKRKEWDYWNPNVTWIPLCTQHVSMDASSPQRPQAWHLPTLCKFGTGSAVALQLAVLKRFNPIYLLGFDLNFQPFPEGMEADPNHFSKDYLVRDMHTPNPIAAGLKNSTHYHAHKMAADAAKQVGVEIINVSRGGKALDAIYPRRHLEDVL